MPSLSSLFRSKSCLRLKRRDSGTTIATVQNPPVVEEVTARTQAQQLANLRRKVAAARAALDALEEELLLVSSSSGSIYLEEEEEEITTAEELVSVDIHVSDMHRSTKALSALLHKHHHNPAPAAAAAAVAVTPSTPQQHNDSSSTNEQAGEPPLYPAPLRVPLRKSPSTASYHQHHQNNPPTPTASSMSFHEWEALICSQTPSPTTTTQFHRSLDHYPPIPEHHTTHHQHRRHVSLPPPPRVARAASFSTEAKTRRLRSLRSGGSVRAVVVVEDGEGNKPLGMEELMGFLREGGSMREL